MSVYFIRAGDDGLVKIGVTTQTVEQRIAALQTAHALPLKCLRVVAGGVDVEHAFHELFACYRVRGEWFRFTPEMLTAIAHPAVVVPLSVMQSDLIAQIEGFLAKSGISETAFGIQAINDGKLMGRLRRGKGITMRNVERVVAFIRSQQAAA